ncbi:MAG: hypothetical protein QOK47_287, partial [Actinomycetota bacterium]|nr:hypothetical protein [Actinomycetota bacterium]
MQRYSRRTRWFHTFVYLVTFLLFATGGWLLFGQEGNPSVIARLTHVADVELHVDLGWALAIAALAVLTVGWRGTATFVKETFRSHPGDFGWLATWPRALFTGRFRRHSGH